MKTINLFNMYSVLMVISITTINLYINGFVNGDCPQFNTTHTQPNSVFTIDKQIYFVSNQTIWKYNIKSKTFTQLSSLENLMDNNTFQRGVLSYRPLGAIHFNFFPCNSSYSHDHCENSKKAKNLVVIFRPYELSSLNVFYSYRLRLVDKKLEFINSNSDMPWNMRNMGEISDDEFWKFPKHTALTSLVFTSGESNAVYASLVITGATIGLSAIVAKKIKTDGIIENEWKWIDVNTEVSGIFAFNGDFFFLNRQNVFYEYNHTLKDFQQVKIESIFNCETNIQTNISTNSVNTNPSDTTKTIPPISTSLSTETNNTFGSTSGTSAKNSNSKIAIFIVLAIILILVIICAIVAYFILKNKNKNQNSKESDSKSKPENPVPAENMAKPELESVEKSTKNEHELSVRSIL